MRRAVVAVVLVALAWGAWRWLGHGTAPAPVRWATATVDRGPVTATVTATGTVNPVETVTVGTYVSGPIEAVLADFNDPVRKDQLLARIDPRPFAMKVQAAEADLGTARAQLEKAKADSRLKRQSLDRMRRLRGSGIVSQSELDAAESDAAQTRAQIGVAEAGVRSAAAKLDEARVNLAYTEIRSPVNGVVVSRNVSVGQTVAASFQTPTLFQVATDLTRMEVAAAVSESDIGAVADGQPVRFGVDAYPGEVFEGTVAQVRNSPVTVQNVVTYDVLVRVDNQALHLKPGMTANVTIVTAQRDAVLRVPTAALRFRPPPGSADDDAPANAAHVVWQPAVDGRVAPVAVRIGVADERFTEITGGLADGAVVVTGILRDPDQGAERLQLPSFGASPRMRRR